ncbi:MAG TPA: M48 family metallopeptidase [Terracidiphilus sp.]|nr:M48 family metallopeptidase [Terracidiphilus sp.]
MRLPANRVPVIFLRTALAASLSTLFTCLCWAQANLPQLPNPGTTSITRPQQQQLGFQAAGEVYKQMPVLSDSSPETQYVRQVGQRLVAVIPKETTWPFQFHVIAQKEINAFALPGGEMFVNIGTIDAAANEAELAGVMAHEMSHVYMQHSAKQMQKAQLTQGLAGLAGAVLGDRGGILGSLGQTGLQIGAGMVMLKYSRTDEAQADDVGARILYRAGYNPQALADFFKKLQAQGGAPPQFLSDHPNPGNREAAIQKEIQPWPPTTYRTDNSAFTTAHNHAVKVKAYSADEIAAGAKSGQWTSLNKQNGAILQPPPGMTVSQTTPPTSTAPASQTPSTPATAKTASWTDVAPSSNFVFTDLGLVQMVRPENWKVIAPQQEGQSVTIAPQAGVIDTGVGYGVVLNGVTPKDKSMTIDQVTDEIVRSLQSGGGDLQPLGKATEIKVAGVRGRSVNLQSTSPFRDAKGNPQKERDRLVTIPRSDGSVIFIVFVAPEPDLNRASPTFERMLRSVQF